VRKSVIAAAAVIALVGAAAAAVPVVERLAAAQVKSGIESDGVTKVGSVEIGLFDRSITLHDLKSAGPSEVSVGRWHASGLTWPLGELLRGRTPIVGFQWGDPLRAERVELQDLRLVDRAAGSRWSMDWLGIDGLDLARFDAAYDGQYPFQALVTRALGALSMRRLEERNVIFAVPGTGDTFGMASVVLEGYQRGRIAAMAIASLEATASDGQAPIYSIAEVKAAGIDLSRIIAAMSSDKWFPGAPAGRVHVDKASAEGFGGETLKRHGISLGGASFETVRENDKVSRTRTRIEGLVLAPPLRGLEGLSMRLTLQSMGLKDVKADFDCVGTEDRGKGELVVDRCAVTGPGLGEIDFTARIVQADATFWNAIDDGDTLALYDSTAALGAARLVLADKSLLERGLKALSTVTGQPVSATRANLARDIRRYQPSGVLISQSMTQLLDTVARFVEQGGTLTIDAQPERPVGFDRFEYLTSPGADLVSVLGLKATLAR
jgi:hypothetical protein